MKVISKLATMLTKEKNIKPAHNQVITNEAVLPYEVMEKSKTKGKGEYNYKALVRFNGNNGVRPRNSTIAAEIQQSMGHHPIGYHCFKVESKEINAVETELTWKSWDSCD